MVVAGEKELRALIDEYLQRKSSGSLIDALLDLQERFGYLPAAGMELLAERFGLRPVNVYAAASFYNRFRFRPPARHLVKVCTGTACHIKQAGKILDHWKRKLEIDEGGMTPDGRYELERVACVGCCTMAPVTVIDNRIVGHMSTSKVDGLLLQHQQEENPTEGVKP